jgi:hypothetical protein
LFARMFHRSGSVERRAGEQPRPVRRKGVAMIKLMLREAAIPAVLTVPMPALIFFAGTAFMPTRWAAALAIAEAVAGAFALVGTVVFVISRERRVDAWFSLSKRLCEVLDDFGRPASAAVAYSALVGYPVTRAVPDWFADDIEVSVRTGYIERTADGLLTLTHQGEEVARAVRQDRAERFARESQAVQ